MSKFIAALILMLAPIMSVSTTRSTDQQTPFTSHDLGDERGCPQGSTDDGCGGPPPAMFVIIEEPAAAPGR
jgi:hypothetical protein